MQPCYLSRSKQSKPIHLVTPRRFTEWQSKQSARTKTWLKTHDFTRKSNGHLVIPDPKGGVASVIVLADANTPLWSIAALSTALPKGDYHLVHDWGAVEVTQATIGWGLGAYRFDRYKTVPRRRVRLVMDDAVDAAEVTRVVDATWLARDLVNTPAADMMPQHLAEQVGSLAERYGADFSQWVGDELLEQNYPAIHSVGRASKHAPRLLDLRWGDPEHPRVTIIGKGVCFDSGGLDLKPSNGMRLMKKDMGGGAHAIALAKLIMDAGLKVRLRLLVPSVENAVDGDAYRPGDVIITRSGLSVEIDNTDAEGRVILCDALTDACAEKPDLVIDFATLTGAARVAVGTEIACMFCNDDTSADELLANSDSQEDPVWRLPLHQPYKALLDSKVADIVNSASSGYGGAITAALYLEAFVPASTSWFHFDIMAWNVRHRAGRPEGGEAMGLRSTYALIKQRYS